ncbi:hypothetical protein F2P81_011017 [Scophthalmus maximus]|uniref:Uncharacterized protein n=1 Tax=Scophthalmus maximus TaxID=52904 RepID=A0A6A4SSU0_SCOMX|nr:hypothetical protein F2P81_011017 [Scophthalmus maximus]
MWNQRHESITLQPCGHKASVCLLVVEYDTAVDARSTRCSPAEFLVALVSNPSRSRRHGEAACSAVGPLLREEPDRCGFGQRSSPVLCSSLVDVVS